MVLPVAQIARAVRIGPKTFASVNVLMLRGLATVLIDVYLIPGLRRPALLRVAASAKPGEFVLEKLRPRGRR
jgi:hypothetical protein